MPLYKQLLRSEIMTENQIRFLTMLKPFHKLRHHWSPFDLSLDLDSFEQDLKLMSSGEKHLAKFFASIWLNDSERFPFDLIQAARTLDSRSMTVIINWLQDPFYP